MNVLARLVGIGNVDTTAFKAFLDDEQQGNLISALNYAHAASLQGDKQKGIRIARETLKEWHDQITLAS